MNKNKQLAQKCMEKISACSEQLFCQKGYEATTISDIASKSGYSRRTIYSYFLNKLDILLHTIVSALNNLYTSLDETVNTTRNYYDNLLFIFEEIQQYYFHHPYSSFLLVDYDCKCQNRNVGNYRLKM
ncbi:MAG: TetR/AcrR family transcriptional regulator [Erysipelotrichaceae bacterium]